ncbi:hypothetical protein BEL04_08630 [Mucilaginibacter sp. PPCGB 2223]|uniref:hypothetical protein n=1 Tax=Mucilaginibacter sp. PPCGB 2223 TaxID=1886027 RepID=UPI000825EC09|nr:hypothetical protein [Mucilaginibacter sp. PPCGB 2223]OCX54314.1 hypothetical protein BEL04_08630 [Mucilaginibacter sp. PPCGB 2223]
MKIKPELYFENFNGFKIADAHFELGSNLHIRDYYYVKRIFYNSFFTNRFALLVAQKLLVQHRDLIRMLATTETIKKTEAAITLVGYENYSDLLLSNIRKMLNDYVRTAYGISEDLFNHDVFTKENVFLKNPNKIANRIILVFPISTTFSTSIRVRGEITEIARDQKLKCHPPEFIDPVVNCIVISNRPLEKNYEFKEISDYEYDYGWRSVNVAEKMVNVQIIDQPSQQVKDRHQRPIDCFFVAQLYLISLVTKWIKISECGECYPSDKQQEKSLIETKIIPVTPSLIFGYPKTIVPEKHVSIFPAFDIRKKRAKEEPMIYRRHFKKLENYYIYYVRTGFFLLENLSDIKIWLADLRSHELSGLIDKSIVIITPTAGSNSGFVNLLNDIVFSETATIIQYNSREEYLQNFIHFYADVIRQAEKIIFVDDAVATTQSFLEIDFFIRNVRDGKGTEYFITLIDRVDYYNSIKLSAILEESNQIEQVEKRFFAYRHIHVSPIVHRDKYPYISLMEKFKELSEKSVLDSMRIHFKNRERHFRPVDLTRDYEKFEHEDNIKSLLLFLLFHEFSALFYCKNGRFIFQGTIQKAFENNEDPNSWQFVLIHFEELAEKCSLNQFKESYPAYQQEIKNSLFKICSSDPFYQHQNIKESAFRWILADLGDRVTHINKMKKVDRSFFQRRTVNGVPLAYSTFQDFKFLLKRGAKLKMNYIYSVEMLYAIGYIVKGLTQYSNAERASQSPISYPIDFITYYVGLLQELIIEHEAKALQVVKNIKTIIDANPITPYEHQTLKNTYNDHFIHLLRMLVLENTFIFHTAAEKFISKYKGPLLFSKNDSEEFFERLDAAMKTYPFYYTNWMLSRFDAPGKSQRPSPEKGSLISFKNMMFLKALLTADKSPRPLSEVSIEIKLREILRLCCEILEVKNGGAYFAVKHKNNRNLSEEGDIAIVASYQHSQKTAFKSADITKESLLYKIFDGINETNSANILTTVELSLDDEQNYRFRDNQNFSARDLYRLSEFQNDLYRDLFYLRITEIEFDEKKKSYLVVPQAILCFYHDKLSKVETKMVHDKLKLIATSSPLAKQLSLTDTPVELPKQRPVYRRFDPKKVRQLLLLRSDLSDFINHHFNNDSLRAYIELINNKKYYDSLKHGTTTYEELVKTHIDKVVNAKNFGDVGYYAQFLKRAYKYLINKLHLLSLTSKLFEDKSKISENAFVTTSVRDIAGLLEQESLYIFTMWQPNLNSLDDLKAIKFINSVPIELWGLQIKIFHSLLDEMIFELLYNIKKHTIHIMYEEISETDPLTITLSGEIKNDGIFWLTITNNFSTKRPDFVRNLSNKLAKRNISDGLNLIYNVLFQSTGQQLLLSAKPGEFSVSIPFIINRKHE